MLLITQSPADTTTEGTETMTFALDNGEAQTTVAIADTSTTPVQDIL